ncbi:MAG: metallophosphoesterase family protein [Schleiferiaceae bacterium]
MTRILLISDTHSFIDQATLDFVDSVDEVWHAGDIGTLEVTDALKAKKPLRAVWGNIDNPKIRSEFEKELIFTLEGVKIYMIHIGGYPPRYTPVLKRKLQEIKPDVFICGHSHITKVMYDKDLKCLHMNPGAAGIHGFHKVRTLLRFSLEAGAVKDLEVIELGSRKLTNAVGTAN